MTADELARVTAERDAAVAALARVEALADEMEADRTVYTTPRAGEIYADRVRVALDDCASLAQRLAEGAAGGEVAPAGSDDAALRLNIRGALATAGAWCGRPDHVWPADSYLACPYCKGHHEYVTDRLLQVMRHVPTDDDLREAIGRAKKVAETRAGES